MAKKTRGHRMKTAKARARIVSGGRGPIRLRPAGIKIMAT